MRRGRWGAALLLALAAAVSVAHSAPPEKDVSHGAISGASPLPSDCGDASGAALHSEVEPHAAVSPADPDNVIATWQQDRFQEHGGARSNVVAASLDGGESWTTTLLPGISDCTGGTFRRATDPWLSIGPDGGAYAVSLAFDGDVQGPNALLVNRSDDGGLSWREPSVVVEDIAFMLNDKEAITADPTRPGYVYVVWARFVGAAVPVTYLSRSTDAGESWLPPLPMPATGQGNQIVVLPDGTLVNVYEGLTGIEAMRSENAGLTWGLPVEVGPFGGGGGFGIRDPNLPMAAVGSDGSICVTWHRGRDIVLARSTDGGRSWRTLTAARGTFGAFLPAVAITPGGVIGVTYYDIRDLDDRAVWIDVRLATSRDAGETWSSRKISGPFDLFGAPYASGWFYGDYDALVASGEAFVPVFARTAAQGTGPYTDVHAFRVVP